jgi:hypothetical protein
MLSPSRIVPPCALLLVFAAPALIAQPPTSAAPSAAPPALAEALKGANKLLAEKKLGEAEAAFHGAESLAGGPCGECLLGLGSVRGFQGKWSEAAGLVERSLPLLTNPGALARAYNQLALAYAASPGADHMADAEQAARKAVGYGGAWGEAARRNLTQILYLEKRWPEVVQVAREALTRAGTDKAAADASRILLCNARYHLPESGPEPDWSKKKPWPLEITRPVKIAGPIPVYTAAAKLHNTQGVVVLDSVIDKEGCVRYLHESTGLPNGLTEVALATVRQWVFSPALLAGEPVSVFYTLTVNFKTSGGGPSDPQPVPTNPSPPGR